MSESAPAEIMEKLAGKFGFGGQEQEVTEQSEAQVAETAVEGQEQPTEETVVDDGTEEVSWNGETYKLPKAIKDALMRQDDYTKKTQELSEQRKTVEHVNALTQAKELEHKFIASIAQEQQELGIMDAYLKQISNVDWSQMPMEQIMRQRIEIDQIKDRRAAISESINGKRTKFMSDIQSKLNELRGKSRELASRSIKGFSEETEKTMRDYAKSEGLTDLEVDNAFVDPRSYKLIWKAMQYEKVAAGTQKAGETAEKVLRPGVAGQRMPKDTANKLAFGKAMKGAKTSSEKASVIEQRLAKGSIFGR